MKHIFFYIIIISQSWLSIGTFCAHIFIPDAELIEIVNEEEKNEKEKEIETEKEEIKNQDFYVYEYILNDAISNHKSNRFESTGRNHAVNITQPPEYSI